MSVDLLLQQDIIVVCAWCELVMTEMDREADLSEKAVSHSICISCSEQLLENE